MEHHDLLLQASGSICVFGHIDPDKLSIVKGSSPKPENSVSSVVSSVEIYLPLGGLVDSEAERERLGRELKTIESQIERLANLLAGDFASKAPPQVVEKERQKLAEYRASAEKLHSQLKN